MDDEDSSSGAMRRAKLGDDAMTLRNVRREEAQGVEDTGTNW